MLQQSTLCFCIQREPCFRILPPLSPASNSVVAGASQLLSVSKNNLSPVFRYTKESETSVKHHENNTADKIVSNILGIDVHDWMIFDSCELVVVLSCTDNV